MIEKLWVVIPAAGVGRRMSGDLPKQYLQLAGRSVIEWSIAPFLKRADVAGVTVVLAADDVRFKDLVVARDVRVRTTVGGAERAESVLRGLTSLQARSADWVLVHDAARPCLRESDLSRLVDELRRDDVGGLLAAPITDTLKASDSSQRVRATIPRESLWRALTPQMFRFELLKSALQAAVEKGVFVTDEAAAIEQQDLQPKLVTGRADNIKITVPEDLAFAEHLLSGDISR